MKKGIAVLLATLVMTVTTSCTTVDHDKTTYYTPSQFDTIMYETLLEFGGEYELGYYISLQLQDAVGGKLRATTVDRKRGDAQEKLGIQMTDELAEVLQGEMLQAVKLPPDRFNSDTPMNDIYTGYDEYIGSGEFAGGKDWYNALLAVEIPAKATGGVEHAVYLRKIQVRMWEQGVCHLFAQYAQRGETFHDKIYVYETRDAQLIQKIYNWAESSGRSHILMKEL